jgi:urease accessory protein UreF
MYIAETRQTPRFGRVPKVRHRHPGFIEMIRKTLPLAQLVLGGLLLVQTQPAFAQAASRPEATQITNAQECTQAIADTQEARSSNPEIGPKAAKIFDEVMELAAKRCEQKQFDNAGELLNIARGMVASE